jgi:hypothetical protein
MNSINPENILDIDLKTISFLTLIDGTILMVDKNAPMNPKQNKKHLFFIIKEQNFIIPNNKTKSTRNFIIYKNIHFSLICKNNLTNRANKDKVDKPIKTDVNINNNENKPLIDNNNEMMDISFNKELKNNIEFNDFNDSNSTLFNIFSAFSNNNKSKRNKKIKTNNYIYNYNNMNNNNCYKTLNKIGKNFNNSCKNLKYYSNYNSHYNIDKIKNKMKNTKHFRQLILEKENKITIIKSCNMYANNNVNIVRPHANNCDNFSMKFNKLINKLKLNKSNKIYKFINYNNNNDINLKNKITINHNLLNFSNSPKYSLRKNIY